MKVETKTTIGSTLNSEFGASATVLDACLLTVRFFKKKKSTFLNRKL
jgi:hypothetical protein